VGGETLRVVPDALRTASATIAGHAAHVAAAAGSLTGSAEMSGAAAMTLHGAFGDYCGACSQRLSSVSAALAGAADSYAAMEQANRHALASIASGSGALVSGLRP
jgi:hypothetical protein